MNNNDLTLERTPEQQEATRLAITGVMSTLLPIDQISTLNRAEAYRLYKMANEVMSYVHVYVNTAWGRFNHLSTPTEDNKQAILLRKIERALNNRGIDINNLIASINEADVSKGDQT